MHTGNRMYLNGGNLTGQLIAARKKVVVITLRINLKQDLNYNLLHNFMTTLSLSEQTLFPVDINCLPKSLSNL